MQPGYILQFPAVRTIAVISIIRALANRWKMLALYLHVMPGTRTFGRGGFFIHGGTHSGSAGCINLHSGMENFVREIDAATKGAPECYVPLTVQY